MIENGITHILFILFFMNSMFAIVSSGQEILDQRISVDFNNENLKSVLRLQLPYWAQNKRAYRKLLKYRKLFSIESMCFILQIADYQLFNFEQ